MYNSRCVVWCCGRSIKQVKDKQQKEQFKNYYNGQGTKNKSLNQGSNKRDEFKTGCERITAQTQFSSVQ